MSSFFTADFVALVIRVGTPLMFCSMSAYVAALAGIPNIAVEGIMLFGALFGVYFSALFSSAWLGLLGVIGVGVVLALVLAFFTMKMKADPIMIGIALNLFATDFSVWLLLVWTGSKGTTANLPSKVLPTVDIPFIKDIPLFPDLCVHYPCDIACDPRISHAVRPSYAGLRVGCTCGRFRRYQGRPRPSDCGYHVRYLCRTRRCIPLDGIFVHLLKQHDRVPWMDRYCGTGSRRRQFPYSHLDDRSICHRTGYRQQAGAHRSAV